MALNLHWRIWNIRLWMIVLLRKVRKPTYFVCTVFYILLTSKCEASSFLRPTTILLLLWAWCVCAWVSSIVSISLKKKEEDSSNFLYTPALCVFSTNILLVLCCITLLLKDCFLKTWGLIAGVTLEDPRTEDLSQEVRGFIFSKILVCCPQMLLILYYCYCYFTWFYYLLLVMTTLQSTGLPSLLF